eukprot:7167842-Lingulodinium_polyedra.AAC.1
MYSSSLCANPFPRLGSAPGLRLLCAKHPGARARAGRMCQPGQFLRPGPSWAPVSTAGTAAAPGRGVR